MSFNYSNPYATQSSTFSGPSAPVARSTFTASLGGPKGYQLFFSGLPTDVTEKELRDLLTENRISMNTSSVQCFYAADQTPLGMALIQVSNEDDAERLRREYSGKDVDNMYKLMVQHMLSPTQSFPQAHIPAYPMMPPAPAAPASNPPQQPRNAGPGGKKGAAAATGGKNPGNDKPPGLSLMKRLSKPGQGKVTDQNALLAKQRANLKGKTGAQALLSRMNSAGGAGSKHSNTSAAAKTKNAARNASGTRAGTSKVGRAKSKVVKDAMDVDKPVEGNKKANGAAAGPGKGGKKAGPPTQQKLDEEMRLWERERRFAAAV